jgi:hypothetical protein
MDESVNVSWNHPDENDVFRWVVHYKYGNNWDYRVLNAADRSLTLTQKVMLPLTAAQKAAGSTSSTSISLNRIVVTAVDRTGNESLPFGMDL